MSDSERTSSDGAALNVAGLFGNQPTPPTKERALRHFIGERGPNEQERREIADFHRRLKAYLLAPQVGLPALSDPDTVFAEVERRCEKVGLPLPRGMLNCVMLGGELRRAENEGPLTA